MHKGNCSTLTIVLVRIFSYINFELVFTLELQNVSNKQSNTTKFTFTKQKYETQNLIGQDSILNT